MWGNPPGGDPTAPPRGPRVSQSSGKNCKNSQKLYENFTYIKIPQILTLTPILGHSPTLGGASGGQNLKMALPGGYLEDRIWVLWNFCPIFGHLTLFWWLKLQILTLMDYPHPLLDMVFKLSFVRHCKITFFHSYILCYHALQLLKHEFECWTWLSPHNHILSIGTLYFRVLLVYEF